MLRTIRFFAFAISIFGFGISLAGSPAMAQSVCGVRADMAKKLAADYQEVPHGMGLTHRGQVLEIFSSPAGTWTIIVTTPGADGGTMTSCLVAHGENWERLPPQIAAEPGETS